MALDFLTAGNRPLFSSDKPVSLTLLTVLFWAVLAGSMVLRVVVHPSTFARSTDDAMRLAELRAWISGQSWFDTTQYRMNTPWGVPMHWSRIIDLGIGSLIVFFRLFLDTHSAEMVAMCVWPLLPLF